jgi:hypothetical protein
MSVEMAPFNQRRQLGQGFDRHEDRADGQRGTGQHDPSSTPESRPCADRVAKPELATGAYAALYENHLDTQRMPGIVNCYLLSVVGRM